MTNPDVAREALEPFKRAADKFDSLNPADHMILDAGGITVGDLRRAREALAALSAETKSAPAPNPLHGLTKVVAKDGEYLTTGNVDFSGMSPTVTLPETKAGESELNAELYRRDQHEPEPKSWSWGRDYGKDLLADLNQLAHSRGTGAILRDGLQRAYREISRLKKIATPSPRGEPPELAAGRYYVTRGDKHNLRQFMGPLVATGDEEFPWQAGDHRWRADGTSAEAPVRDIVSDPVYPPLARGEPTREAVATAIRAYCREQSPGSIQTASDGIERIYYSGLSVSGLADAIAALYAQPPTGGEPVRIEPYPRYDIDVMLRAIREPGKGER